MHPSRRRAGEETGSRSTRVGSDWEPLQGVESGFLLLGESQAVVISLEGLDVSIVLAPQDLLLPKVLQELRSVDGPGN